MTDTLLVRLKPYDPRRGFVLRRFTYAGIRFQDERGWYRVERKVGEHLRAVRTVPTDKYAPLAFDALPQPESDQYTLTSDCPELLAPDARCTLTYRFQPRAAGSDDTEAAIATNGGTRKLRLWGYAAAAPVDEGDRIFLPHVPTE